ncbi:MAG: hypothetical protein PHQ75_09810 [Thermoguttaceae bacterium]|nr:hypothetical protein [Thermoguttaceae bacterium]
MTPPKDDLILRLDARHDDLLKRIADLDRRTNAVLAQWTGQESDAKQETEKVQAAPNH